MRQAVAPCGEALDFLGHLVPGGRPFPALTVPLAADECHWFMEGVKHGLFEFHECRQGCSRLRGLRAGGPDEFLNPRGARRHLYSGPDKPQPTFNREYLPHLAAHARTILEFGYPKERADLSQYFRFKRHLISKKKGGRYEVDSLSYEPGERPYLHIEVKAHPTEIERMARAINQFTHLSNMPTKVVKEVEYVLDLAPVYLWLIGPGSVDPEAHVWAVKVDGLSAAFHRVPTLPPAPTA